MALRMKELRLQKGWTQQTLAGKASLSRSQLAEIENGTKLANTRRLGAIAEALGVRVAALFASDGTPTDTDVLLDHAGRLSDDDRRALIRHAEALASRWGSGRR